MTSLFLRAAMVATVPFLVFEWIGGDPVLILRRLAILFCVMVMLCTMSVCVHSENAVL